MIKDFYEYPDLIVDNADAIASMLEAIENSMTSTRRSQDYDDDTLFMAGVTPQGSQINELADFVRKTNWNVVYLCFNVEKLRAGVVEIEDIACFLQCTPTDVVHVKGGKTWRSGQNEKISIVFPEAKMKCFKSRKGQLRFGGIRQRCLGEGFERARSTIASRLLEQTGGGRVFTNIGSMPVIHTIATMAKAMGG